MERLQIGEIINKLRKERKVTQEQLAGFIGVSTAAVSKWESNLSYPDITLLPVLASFFNVTIDKLLNYNIELSNEEVMKIYSECESCFSRGDDVDKVIELCMNYISKYPGSYFLKFRIGYLFFIYSWKGGSEEKAGEMMQKAIGLFEDVADNSSDIDIVEPSLFELGALYMSVGEQDKAVEALNKIRKSQCDPNDLLAAIYIEQNKHKEARKLLQGKLYQSIFYISHVCMGLANSYLKSGEDFGMVEKYYNLAINIKKSLTPNGEETLSLSTEYLHLATSCLEADKTAKAIESLKTMVEYMKKSDINQIQDINNIWCFSELETREKTITMNLYENIFKMFEDPRFDTIREHEDFISILETIKRLEDKSLKM